MRTRLRLTLLSGVCVHVHSGERGRLWERKIKEDGERENKKIPIVYKALRLQPLQLLMNSWSLHHEGRKRGRKNGLAEFCCWNSIESISREPFIQGTCYQMVWYNERHRLKDREWDPTDFTGARQVVVLWLFVDNCLQKWKTGNFTTRLQSCRGENL